MRKISIEINDIGNAALLSNERLGFSGEHNAVAICFSVGQSALQHFCLAEYFRVVIDGCYSDKLMIENEQIVYLVPQSLMTPPSVHCQLIGYKESDGEPVLIAKSSVVELCVDYSETPIEEASSDSGIFEKAMAYCDNATQKIAEQITVVENSAAIALQFAEDSKAAETNASSFANEAAAQADRATMNADKSKSYAQMSENLYEQIGDVANALKGSVSGDTVVMGDVSPLEHEIKVTLGNLPEGQEVILAEYSGLAQYESVPFEGRSKVTVDFTTVMSGARLVPSIDSGAAVVSGIQIGAGDVDTAGSITVYIEGSMLYWEGTSTVLGENYQLSGSVNITRDGEPYENGLITGFYIDGGDVSYIKVSENQTPAVKLYKGGKNLIDHSLHPTITHNGLSYEYLPDEDCVLINGTNTSNGSIKVTFSNPITRKSNEDYYVLSAKYVNGNITKPSGGYAVIYLGVKDSLSVANSSNWLSTNLLEKDSSASQHLTKNYITDFWFYTTKGVVLDNYKVKLQLEKRRTASEYEKYVAPTKHTPNSDGTASVPSLYPTTRLYTDTEGVTISAEYNKDINKAFASLTNAIISLGGNV